MKAGLSGYPFIFLAYNKTIASQTEILMKASQLNRIVHRWGSILIAIPTLCVLLSGVLLQLKKQSPWIQPATMKGAERPPMLSFSKILEISQSVTEAQIDSWDDIDRLDFRPSKGMVKIRAKNRWELQVDTSTGQILQVAFRRSDLIESIHDGSFFGEAAKLGVFFPSAVVLLVLWGTGIYLFFLPKLAKRKKRLKKNIANASGT